MLRPLPVYARDACISRGGHRSICRQDAGQCLRLLHKAGIDKRICIYERKEVEKGENNMVETRNYVHEGF